MSEHSAGNEKGPSHRRLRGAMRMGGAILVWFAVRHLPSDVSQFENASLVTLPHVPAHEWRLVEERNWQIVGTSDPDAGANQADDGTQGDCPSDMVEVQGKMKVDGPLGSVEALQEQTCSSWINRSFPERCGAYDADKWRSLSSGLPVRSMHFCIDRFEYPNTRSAYPVIMVTWHEAGAFCEERGARLCTEDEWTFACEGEEALPFATGYVRDPFACVMDRGWRFVDEQALADRTSERALREIDDLWQGAASGSSPQCRSPFGAYDMTGNVDEWTRSTHEAGLRSILKGGYWGPVRSQCRPSTRVHNEDFYFYQIGFRCCADAPAPSPP